MSEQRKFHMHDGKLGAAITVRITPRSSKNEISEVLNDGTIKIRLTAPPLEGKANEMLIEFLADVLDVKKGQLDIVAGTTGREKIITITGLDAATVQARLLKKIS
jgi:uncharacterized protein (TIGR00251 family)